MSYFMTININNKIFYIFLYYVFETHVHYILHI